MVVFKFAFVEVFAAGCAVEVVLAVGIELPDPFVVHVEPTKQGRARRWHGLCYLYGRVAQLPPGSTATPPVATRITPRALMVPPKSCLDKRR